MTSLAKANEPKDAPKRLERFFTETTVEAELSLFKPGVIVISADHPENPDSHLWKLDLEIAATELIGDLQDEHACGHYVYGKRLFDQEAIDLAQRWANSLRKIADLLESYAVKS